MNELETINKGQVQLWRGNEWYLFTQHFKPKRFKFFLANPNGEYRVRLKDKVIYQGKDLEKAIEVYNEI